MGIQFFTSNGIYNIISVACLVLWMIARVNNRGEESVQRCIELLQMIA